MDEKCQHTYSHSKFQVWNIFGLFSLLSPSPGIFSSSYLIRMAQSDVLLVACGSFNPPTIMHLRMFGKHWFLPSHWFVSHVLVSHRHLFFRLGWLFCPRIFFYISLIQNWGFVSWLGIIFSNYNFVIIKSCRNCSRSSSKIGPPKSDRWSDVTCAWCISEARFSFIWASLQHVKTRLV